MTPAPELDSSIAVENGVPLEQSTPMKSKEPDPWYKRPRILYMIVAVVLLISLAGAAFAILWATGTIDVKGLGGGNAQASSATGSDNQDAAATEAPVDAGSPPPSSPPQGVPATEPTAVTETVPTAVTETVPTAVTETVPTAETETSQPSAIPTSALPTALPTDSERTDPLAFYVMGDTPYANWEAILLGTQMTQMNANLQPGAEFTVHVGDIQRSGTDCALDHFFEVANILSAGPLSTFVLPGDNDYLDCTDKEVAWSNYLTTFVGFEGNWTNSLDVERWTVPMSVPMENNLTREVAKPQMFAFVEDGILFVSYTLMNMNLRENEPPDVLFYERLADSKAWVTKQLAEKQPFRGVVMFSHAVVTTDIRPFFEDLRDVFFNASVYAPVLYIHGDGHEFSINTDFGTNLGWPQLTRVEVDQGAYADPLIITVAPIVGGQVQPLTADDSGLQFVLSNGLFLLDRQNGRYPDSVNPNN